MLCAHTVRRLKPGTYDQFRDAFMPAAEEAPAGWVRFHMLRGVANPDEVVTFGFFDGTLEELEGSQDASDFEQRRTAIAEYVDAVGVNCVYEVSESLALDSAA